MATQSFWRAAVLVGLMAASASRAQPVPRAHSFTAAAADADDVTVTGLMDPPPWKATFPGEVEPERYYPEKAALAHVEGYATLRCQAALEGGPPHDCRVVEDTPEGWNFGETAVRVIAAKVNVTAERAQALDGTVFLGFAFRLKGASAPPPSVSNLSRPKFTHTPDDDDLAGALRAADPEFSGPGWAFVRCVATKEGRLADCTPLASSDSDGGLGRAVALLAGKFKLARTDANGAPVAGRPIRLRVRVSW